METDSKKWKSMPQLDDNEEDETLHTAVMAETEVEKEFTPVVVKCNVDQDDRHVCNEVPFRERLQLFESMTKSSKLDDKKKKLWSSMPALDKKPTHYSMPVTSYPVYHRSPSLNTTTRSKSAVPLALVGSSTALNHIPESSTADYELTPLKDRLKVYQAKEEAFKNSNNTKKPVFDTSKPVHRYDVTLESPNFDDSASMTDSMASSHTSNSTVISASKINNKVIPTYSWNDESNGEIYNEDSNRIMYVVENGKEFPLQSLSKRKLLFLNEEDKKNFNTLKPVAKKEIISDEQHEYIRDDFIGEDEDEPSEDVVKSSHVPYIEEEQNVLSNINLVKAMKEKFKYN